MAVIQLPHHAAVYGLPRNLDVLNVSDRAVRIAATDDELTELRSLGYVALILKEDYQAWLDSVLLGYRTYAQVCSVMVELARTHPGICRLDTLGFSVQNRAILMMRVSDYPQVEEHEPEFRIIGAHHGHEKISTEVVLSFLQYVCESYDTSSAVRRLVDSTELWVIPILNVDGHVANQRLNANNVDLNRDYGYRWSGHGNSASPFSQRETRLVRQHGLSNNIVMEFAFHSDASYVNYVWDSHPADPPDSVFIAALAEEYADSTYGSPTTRLEPINGYDWYEVHGACQDASFGLNGSIAYTIETRQPTAQAQIDSICVANCRALLGMMRACRFGVSGQVRDSLTGAALFARISVDRPPYWDCYTDPVVGDFHRPLPAGTYTLTAHAQGYRAKSIMGIVAARQGTGTVEFELAPDAAEWFFAEEIVWLNHADPNKVTPTASIRALGPPDDSSFSLGRTGDICLSIGRGTAVHNVPGGDITVFDNDSVTDGYWLYVGNDWSGPWTALGHVRGTHSFDLGAAGLDSARYVRIVCDSTGSSDDPKAGLDLDAVAFARPWTPDPGLVLAGLVSAPTVRPSPGAATIHFLAPPGSLNLKIIDIAGRTVECYTLERQPSASGGPFERCIDVNAAGLASGVYVALFQTRAGTSQHKFVVARP